MLYGTMPCPCLIIIFINESFRGCSTERLIRRSKHDDKKKTLHVTFCLYSFDTKFLLLKKNSSKYYLHHVYCVFANDNLFHGVVFTNNLPTNLSGRFLTGRKALISAFTLS